MLKKALFFTFILKGPFVRGFRLLGCLVGTFKGSRRGDKQIITRLAYSLRKALFFSSVFRASAFQVWAWGFGLSEKSPEP